jgi:SAM-dependent methyltransferase
MTIDAYEELGIEELRRRLLEHTRKAYGMLRLPDRPQILDIGCGRGIPTVELARLSGGEVVGIDTDDEALSHLRRRVEQEGFTTQVTVLCRSLYEVGLDNESFDLLWEEGVLHLLENSKSFRECNRLLKPGGFLVMHETINWFESIRDEIPAWGFRFDCQHLLPKDLWWDQYGAPLERRIQTLRESGKSVGDRNEFFRYEQEVAAIKADSEQLDCGFFAIKKRD